MTNIAPADMTRLRNAVILASPPKPGWEFAGFLVIGMWRPVHPSFDMAERDADVFVGVADPTSEGPVEIIPEQVDFTDHNKLEIAALVGLVKTWAELQ